MAYRRAKVLPVYISREINTKRKKSAWQDGRNPTNSMLLNYIHTDEENKTQVVDKCLHPSQFQ